MTPYSIVGDNRRIGTRKSSNRSYTSQLGAIMGGGDILASTGLSKIPGTALGASGKAGAGTRVQPATAFTTMMSSNAMMDDRGVGRSGGHR